MAETTTKLSWNEIKTQYPDEWVILIDVDPHAAGAVGLGGGDRDAAVARTEVVDHVVGSDLGEFQHRIDNFLGRGNEDHVRRAELGGLLRRRRPGHDRHYCKKQNEGSESHVPPYVAGIISLPGIML